MNEGNAQGLGAASLLPERKILGRLLIIVILASGMCTAIMYSAITPVLPGMAAYFGGGERGSLLAQLVMTMPGLGMMIGGPLSGVLIERWGERIIILASVVIFTLTGSAGLFLEEPAALLSARFFQGIAACSFITSSLTLLSRRFELQVRIRMLSYHTALGAMAGLVALLAAGVSADLGSWRTPFSFHLLGVFVFLLAVIAVPGFKGRVSDNVISNKALLPLFPVYLLCIPLFMVIFTTSVQVPFLLEVVGVTNAGTQSRVLAAGVVGFVVGAGAFGRLLEPLGAMAVLSLGLVLMGLGHVALGLSTNGVMVAVACFVSSLGGGLLVPHITHTLIEKAPEALRGRALGFFPVFTYLGSFLNPLAYAPLISSFGIKGALLVAGCILATASIAVLIIRQRQQTLVI